MKDHSTLLISDASRRDFFKQLVLGGSGLYLSPLLFQSCTSEDLGRPPFGIWEDMIKMLEQSPDHLIGRRKALVASKDPKALSKALVQQTSAQGRMMDDRTLHVG